MARIGAFESCPTIEVNATVPAIEPNKFKGICLASLTQSRRTLDPERDWPGLEKGKKGAGYHPSFI